jgi:hypothetical protein
MSAPTSTITTWQWSADVLDFAAQRRVEACLDPLREVTQRLFPTASSLRVFLEGDPELRDEWHIVFEVDVPKADVPNYLEARHRWTAELFRLCPAPLVCTFCLTLLRTDP